MAPVLGYWKIRGLAQPIRLFLTYVDEQFDDKHYLCGPGPAFDRSAWNDEKLSLGLDFPNLPYYIDGDVKLTQSMAILRHLARKHDLCGKTEKERMQADLVLCQVDDYRHHFSRLCYDQKYETLKDDYIKVLPKYLESLSKFLGDNKYFAGENITLADFVAYEYIYQQSVYQPNCLTDFANLQKFKDTFENLPTISAYIKNSPSSKLPFNNRSAKYGSE